MNVDELLTPPLSQEELMASILRKVHSPEARRIPGVNLKPYPEAPTTPKMPDMGNLPDVESLYSKLDTLNQKPLDYSGLEKVNKSRTEGAQRDFLGGLALSAMGGKHLSNLGASIFRQSLADSEPIRANLADVGYSDPETGKFIENPMVARNRDEKFIAGRIDALTKAEERKAALALQQGNLEIARASKANADALRLLALSIAADRNAVAREKAAASADKPQKPLPPAQSKAWIENSTSMAKVDDALKDVEANPDAFGMKTILPQTLTQRIPAKGWEGGVAARAGVFDIGSLRIHERSGAAVTAAESPRLQPFIPVPGDNAATIKDKLRKFRRQYELIQAEIEQYAEDMNFKPPSRSQLSQDAAPGGVAPATPASTGWKEVAPGVRMRVKE